MLFKEFKIIFHNSLSHLYDEKERESIFYIIVEHIHKLKRIDLALHPELGIDELQLILWENSITQLKSNKPIQYILGETEFYGLRFEVNEHVLIPRTETEELVELILSESTKSKAENKKESYILDIGTGSGCIAIALAKNLPDSKVFALDVSEKALELAQKNAEINQVDVHFVQRNILETDDLGQKFDVIVSNPPYVRMLEKHEIKPNVLDFEPHLALFVEDDDALLFYRKIIQLAEKHLTQNGKLYFEINQYLGKETVELCEKSGFKNVQLITDMYGNHRMISCVLNTVNEY